MNDTESRGVMFIIGVVLFIIVSLLPILYRYLIFSGPVWIKPVNGMDPLQLSMFLIGGMFTLIGLICVVAALDES